MNKIIDNIKSGNYEVVDNQGVSVTGHFTQCLEKEFADLEAKLEEKDKQIKELEMAFELCYAKMLYITKEYTNLSAIPSKEHFKQQAKEMLENE